MSEELSHQDARILIVDDDLSVTELTHAILQSEGYTNVRVLNDPRGMISQLIEFKPDLIVLDLMMPYLDGFQLMSLIQCATHDAAPIPILVVSALGHTDVRYQALDKGAIDVFPKPFEPREFLPRVANLLDLRLAYRHVKEEQEDLQQEVVRRTQEMEEYQLEIRQAQMEVIARLARAAEHRDDDTGQHTQRVGLICSLLASTLELPDEFITTIMRAAPLHDVGKIGVPDAILLKPGRLDETELAIMRTHCIIGADLLAGGHSDVVQAAERITLSHHEKWNGQGYPDGLSGYDICVEGRLLAVADVFDALTHERPYKKAWPVEDAIAEIKRQRGEHFDPQIVDAFLALPHHQLI